MAPPHTTAASRPADDLDDLFNFLDADTNNNENTPNHSTDTNSAAAPNRRRLSGDNPLGVGLGIDEEVKVRKPRAPVAKLDEDRILSEKGIPRLRRITKERLRFKGKGYEFQDVSRLLSTYQLWLDSLFPKANFADGIAMIEKLGHKKRLQVMRKAWIDEDRPKPAAEEEDEDFVAGDADRNGTEKELNGDATMDDAEQEAGGSRIEDKGESQEIGQLRSSSPLMLDDDDEELYAEVEVQEPTTKAAEAQEPDEDELDALLAEEGMTEPPKLVQNVVQRAPEERDDFADEEEAMMDMW